MKEPLKPEIPDDATFKIIGLGGVGGPIARGLAIFLAASNKPTRLVLIDGDSFEPSNATRMIFGDCGNKAEVIRKELLPRFNSSSMELSSVEEFVTPENIDRLIREQDVVLLAVDNHATRKLVSDHCGRLKNVCLISGGNDGVENGKRGTFGNVQVYLRKDGTDATFSLTAMHPEIDNPKDKNPADQSCTDLIKSVPQILFTNLTVASSMLNTLFLELAGKRQYEELVFDIAEGLMRPVKLR